MSDATMLAEAKEALHDIIRGQQVRQLTDQNGETIIYSRTNISQLRAYIAELERSCVSDAVGSSGPLRFFF